MGSDIVTADKKTDVWMPLWIGAYLADTMAFTTEQHGAYLLLILAYWRERAPLADDDDTLRGITKLDRCDWKRVRPVLAKKFRVADGVWWHKRVEHEMAAADARAKKASEKAAKAAQARWQAAGEQSTSNAPSMPQALLEDMRDECPPPSPCKDISEPTVPPPPADAAGPKTPTVPCPFDALVDAYHLALPTLPRVRLRDGPTWDDRKKAMRKVWAWVLSSRKSDGSPRAATGDQALEWFRGYFARAAENDWLMGRTAKSEEHRNWQCDLDFLLSKKGMKAVIEKTQDAA